ncbi:hypothetical protein TNCV_43071 [Trichonephila clavipes]|nr:hypothetical protein TNCV_43071 [Trichonephila clavipes]
MDDTLKKTSSGKRPKKKGFQGNKYLNKSVSENVKSFIEEKAFRYENGGKDYLTDAVISKLAAIYGNAIRADSQNVNEIRQAVWTVWAHTSSTDAEPKHFAQKAKIAGVSTMISVHNNTVNEFRHKNI